MHHCHSFSRFSRPYRPVIIDMCVSLAFARVGQPIAWSLGTSDGASRSLGKMSSSSNSVADCSSWPDARYARARCHCSHLIPPCDSCANHRLGRHPVCCRDRDCRHIGTCTRPLPLPYTDPTAQDFSTSSKCWWSPAPADELRGHQYTWTPVDIVSTRFCAAASAAVRSRVAAASGTVAHHFVLEPAAAEKKARSCKVIPRDLCAQGQSVDARGP